MTNKEDTGYVLCTNCFRYRKMRNKDNQMKGVEDIKRFVS